MTKEDLLKEIDKVEDLLSIVDVDVYIDDSKPDEPCIRLIDEQGVCSFSDDWDDYDDDDEEDDEDDYEDEWAFYNAQGIMDACEAFFNDTYLIGEVCCDCDHDFETYAEAEEEARSTGYIEEADIIHELRKYYE